MSAQTFRNGLPINWATHWLYDYLVWQKQPEGQ